MKNFDACLRRQLQAHPSMLPQDVVKLCYQAACGAEHMLEDFAPAEAALAREFAAVPMDSGPLTEEISADVCRVNLGAWKRTGMPVTWLFRMFSGGSFQAAGKERLTDYLQAAQDVLETVGFDMVGWRAYAADYMERGMPAVRHSETYRVMERPAYRIVPSAYLRILPILMKITRSAAPYVIAIDGMAGAGKSTAAALLGKVLDCDVVHMDDFFLPMPLRTAERLAEAGGNIHYERFIAQVLPKLRAAEGFAYDRFDCGIMDYNGSRTVGASACRVVEGAYAHHPRFGGYMDLRVFAAVDGEEQLRRIEARNGAALTEQFRTRWIPMENRYFETYHIREQADVVI